MHLTDLPNEILAEIAHHTLPEGFDSLNVTSKHIHEICAPLMKQHNDMRQRAFSFDEAMSAFTWIYRIATTPLLGRYIEYPNLDQASLSTRLPEDYTELE